MRKWQSWVSVIGVAITASAVAWAADPVTSLRDALYARFQPSLVEMERPERQGAVARQGKLMVLAIDGVLAKPFRVVRAGPKSPPLHVMEFALVEVAADGTVAAQPGPLTLHAGTRLVVLDLRLEGDRVHLLTHTVDPVPGGTGTGPVYGRTELVFRVAPQELRTGAFEPLAERIEWSLTWTPDKRVCAPDDRQLRLEP